MQAFATLQRATLQARQRSGNQSIGTQLSKGRLQVVSVVYRKGGSSIVSPLSDWLSMADAVKFLDALQ